MITKVILLGGHIQALGLARQVHKKGLPVTLCVADGYAVARFSNAVSSTNVFPSFEQLEEYLISVADKNALLFPTSDDYIDFLSERSEKLSPLFQLGIPSQEIIDIFSDKRRTHSFAEQCGVPHPKSWCPETMEDVENLSLQIPYPIVLKPAVMYTFHKQFGKKAYLCKNKEDLLNRCATIAKIYPIKGVLLQEFLSGGAPTLYSFGVYAENGVPQAWIMANRIRQNPMDFGNSTTYAISCNIPEIEASACKILQETKYTGLAEIEFMYDAKTGTYKFLEINMRAWKWHTISNQLGFGFITELIAHNNGMSIDFKPNDKIVGWVERLTDWSVILKEIIHRRMSLKKVIKSYRIKHENAVWSWRDPLPALMYVLLSPILYIKRH